MRKKLMLSLIALMCACTACTTNKTQDAIVIEKIHEDGSNSIKIEDGSMSTIEHPETYILVFEYEDQEGEMEVSKEEFDSTNIGDTIKVPLE